jgi:2-isopropylmalate synthase
VSAKFVAFGMTKRAGVSASNDPGLAALVQSKSDAICFVAKSWDYHVRVALGCTNEENLDSIRASVEAAGAAGKEALVDCEHFFDGFKANADYALACAHAACDAGARWVVLCDTNGGPALKSRSSARSRSVPGDRLGIHAHDDTGRRWPPAGCIEAGVRRSGHAERYRRRCGAPAISIVRRLLKPPLPSGSRRGSPEGSLASRGWRAASTNSEPRAGCAVALRRASAFATRPASTLRPGQGAGHLRARAAGRVGNRRKVMVSTRAARPTSCRAEA